MLVTKFELFVVFGMGVMLGLVFGYGLGLIYLHEKGLLK